MARFATSYIAAICILFFACNGLRVGPPPVNNNSASTEVKTPQLEEYSADAGLYFFDKINNTWMYQVNTVHPAALRLKELISAVSDKITDDVFSLTVREAIKNAHDSFEKIKILHDFVAIYLTYNVQKVNEDEYIIRAQSMRTNYRTVIKEKRAVCAGYAILFKAACHFANIPGVICNNVMGRARKVSVETNTAGKKIVVIRQIPHVWNVVDINGQGKYLVDTTWDSMVANENVFVNQYSSSFLFVDPKALIYTHFPDLPQYQLLKRTLSRTEYSTLPYFDISFFTQGMKPLTVLSLFTESSEATSSFAFFTPKSLTASMEVDNVTNDSHEVLSPVLTDSVNTFKYEFKAKGIHEFRLYIKDEIAVLYYVKHN